MLERKKGVNQGNGLYGRHFKAFKCLIFDIESHRSKMKQFTQINGCLNRLFTSKAPKCKIIYRK